MSGSSAITPVSPDNQFSSDALSDDEKVNIRRFCGYPAYGAGNSGFQGWRFFQAYGLLEYRLGVNQSSGVPNMSPSELALLRQFLQTLYTLEAAIPSSGSNLDTDSAALWIHNKNELLDRLSLYNIWRRELCGVLGVPCGPALQPSGNSVRCVN
jgi:hypothetical protein